MAHPSYARTPEFARQTLWSEPRSLIRVLRGSELYCLKRFLEESRPLVWWLSSSNRR